MEAKVAGAAPIRRGQPGHRDALDSDEDGVA
ncbi:excalibur calcium-binding domain-containing protein [Streptomyces sp. NPDC023588]